MNEASLPMTDRPSKENKVYVKFSLSKYPFLKSVKVGDTGELTYKGEITNSETQEDDCVKHDVSFSDISNKRESVRI